MIVPEEGIQTQKLETYISLKINWIAIAKTNNIP
jgi:hypothetical protein